ncbi:MAG: hypothetical protein ACRDNF_12510, partial [Streptosporangiaceae bacterium]
PSGQILVNEINTMPGMTPASAFPMMWEASGLPLPALVDRIIQTALRGYLLAGKMPYGALLAGKTPYGRTGWGYGCTGWD